MRSERGATLIVVSLVLTAVLGVASLSIDGGRMFGARRQTQNGADAAAMAGAEALFAYQYAAATGATRDPTAVAQAVSDKLLQNGATTQACTLVDPLGNPLGSCSGASDAQLVAASGVKANGTVSRPTALAGVIGINRFNAAASATAEVQPIVGVTSPFILCGAAHTGWNILDNGNQINVPAAQQLINIPLQSDQVPTCGARSDDFKGKASQNTGVINADTWVGITPGNGYNALTANSVSTLAACPPDISALTGSCTMIIPVASSAQGTGVNTQLQIATFAAFTVSPSSNGGTKYTGTFVAPQYLAGEGQGAYGVRCNAGNELCLAKLVG